MSKMKKLTALLLALVMVLALAACGGTGDDTTNNDTSNPSTGDSTEDTTQEPDKSYTYKMAFSTIAANWNPLDYEGNDASQILGPLGDSLYMFAFNDELHPLDDPNRQPYDGYIVLPAMAADYPVDVTEKVKAEHPEFGIPEDATSGYAWAVPLRQDLYFDTGYHITADTFVQSMKYLLDPRLNNYRATDAFTAPRGVVGAEAYFNSGRYSYDAMVSADMGADEYVDPSTFTTTDAGTLQLDGKDIVMNVKNNGNWGGGDPWSSYIPEDHQLIAPMHAAADQDGYVKLTPEMLTNLQTIIAMLHGYATVEEYAADAGDYAYQEFEEACWYGYVHDPLEYDGTVGVFAMDEYTLVNVFVNPIRGFYLYYGGLKDTLVEPDVYEASLSQDESGNWQSSYMTSKATSPSYGPYSMSDYQTDKMVHYVKNDKWYGWTEDVYHVYKDPNDGNVYHMNQTTEIDIQMVAEIATERNMFLAGQLMDYGLRTEDYEQYGLSEYAQTSPRDSIYFLLLTGDMDGIQAREAAADFDQTKYDLETITLESFRRAFAISFDRQAFCNEVHPAYAPGFGIFGATVIYDPETAGIYRDTDEAKQALCDFYSVDTSKFASLDEAVDSITGFDPVTAKELYQQAFEEALEKGYITDADNDGKCDQELRLTYSITSPDEDISRRVKFLNTHVGEAINGTPFEGKISFVESAPLGDPGAYDAIKDGTCDIMISGWTGSPMDPYYLLLGAYVSSDNAYAKNWYDPTKDMITLDINGEEITWSMADWASAVNGNPVEYNGKTYRFGAYDTDPKTRLKILAACENALLQTYTYIPMVNPGSKSLLSQQIYTVIEDYNVVMDGRGGLAYTRYNYDDAAWEAYCNEQIAAHGQLQY